MSGRFTNDLPYGGKHIELLDTLTITTALSGTYPGEGGSSGARNLAGMKYLTLEAIFTYGSGGTSAKAYIQTSLDNGATWFDIACFAFTTSTASKVSSLTAFIAPGSQAFAPADAALSDNTVVNGVLGDRIRLKLTTVGTYAGGTTLEIHAWAK